MSKLTQFKQAQVGIKHPTVKEDITAYASESQKSFNILYNQYVQSVETVERVIRLIANITSLTQFKIYKEDTKGELVPLKVKNVDMMFPNEVDTHVDFKRKLAVSIFTQGAGIVVAESSKGMTNFYVLDIARVSMESNGKNLIDEFVYKAENGAEIRYKAKDVIYVNDSVDPSNLIYSLSRLKPLNDVIQMQAGIVARTKEFAAGNAKESMIVSTETPMSADTQGKIKTAFDTFMKSSSSTSLFLNTKLDTKLVSSAMSGADMLAFFKEVNQVIINSFNLPPHLLGDLSKSGANKSDEVLYALRIWFTTNLLPVIRNIELHFTRYFRLQLGLKQAVVKLDLSDIDILDDFIEMKTDRAIKLSKAGLMSVNEARALIELPRIDVPSADLHFMPAYLLGSAPVSLENFTTEVERLLQGAATAEPLPTGNSGDEDNTNVITDSRGGASDE